jgi:two-component system, OmpR family, sensor kinase
VRRRFTLAIVGVVAGALLVAGLGTLLVLTVQGRRAAKRDVIGLADRLANQYAQPATAGDPVPALRNLQDLLRSTQQLTIVAVARTGAQAGEALPGGLADADLDRPALSRGQTVSGFHGRTAFAVVPFTNRGRRLAVVVTQEAAGATGAGLYFLLAGAFIVAVAFGVAESLARRITGPLVRAQEAAGRIAQGDLSARVPEPAGVADPELRSLSASINAMADNLERLRGQERQFLLSVSHDLRTPLTSIRGFAEALADGTTTDTQKAAGIIASEARRLQRLVADLLDLAKLDARGFSLDLRPTDVPEVVGDTAHGFAPTAEALGLSVVVHDPVVEGGAVMPPAGADPDRLAQVVANLVENACKYAARTIDVGTWYRHGTRGAEALITVDDDGPGIATDDLPHVFERLWTAGRGDHARPVGSGLGLAIVAELVGAMGGTIRAESPVPRWDGSGTATQPGTRLVVSLAPWSAAPSSAAPSSGAPSSAAPSSGAPSSAAPSSGEP